LFIVSSLSFRTLSLFVPTYALLDALAGTSFAPAPVIPIEIEREEVLGQLPSDVNAWTPIHVRQWLRYKQNLGRLEHV
jgi:hypothetical protein